MEAALAIAVGPVFHPHHCVVDLLDGQRRLAREGQISFAVHRHGAALPGLLVELHVTRLALESQ